MNSRSIIALIGLLTTTMMTSCRKELTYPSEMDTVKVSFDWSQAPDAYAEGMVVLFYPVDGGRPWRFDYSGMGGGIAKLPPGQYRIITHNNDTDGVVFSDDDDFYNYSVATLQTSLFEGLSGVYAQTPEPRSRNGSEQPVVVAPDIMWCYAQETPFDTSEGAVTLSPKRITNIIRYNVTDIKNLDQVAMMSAAVTGLPESHDFATNMCTDRMVTIPGTLAEDGKTSAHGYTTAFAGMLHDQHEHNLQLFFWLTDGTRCFFDIDVTDQFHNAPDPLHVTLNVSGIELPMSSGESGPSHGLGVGVDGWDRVDIELSN